MPHTIETATSGRAKCRGCEHKIAKGEPRFGERQANIFGDGEMTLWFHLRCGAFKRPEPFLEVLAEHEVEDGAALEASARFGIEHRRLPRVDSASRAPTGRARCRHCRELIEKDTWRIGLVYFEEFRFAPSGYIHASCASDYLGTVELLDRIGHFSPDLEGDDIEALTRALA
jgi:hypothetical protein